MTTIMAMRHHDHHAHSPLHDDEIKGVSLSSERPMNGAKLTRWLNELLQERGPDILRAKGILDVAGEDKRLVFQAVHMILDGELQRPWREVASTATAAWCSSACIPRRGRVAPGRSEACAAGLSRARIVGG